MKTTKGLYIHIPFCLSKCTYCDFYSVAQDTETMGVYVEALVKEIELVSDRFSDSFIDTIYIGGGTPSVLPPQLLEKIVNSIHKNFKLRVKEFSIEANPATDLVFKNFKDLGINRLSLGVQTLNNDILKFIGRRHDSTLALETIHTARNYFDNVSCDLMIGLPSQSVADVEYAVDALSNLVSHVSMYMLKLSNTVKMYQQLEKGLINLPDDDLTVDFYNNGYEILRANGFNRYEISNFSLTGRESLHNLKYWNREDYIGLGASAHGFVDGYRYFNPSSIQQYILGNNFGSNNVNLEFVNEKDAIFEEIMLSLRLSKGLNLKEFKDKFNLDFEDKYKTQLRFLSKFLEKKGDYIAIKEDYLLLESAIAREFLI